MSLKVAHEDPRTVRTRGLLMEALRVLLQNKDIHDISVKEITTQATLNRATLYDHYRDKNELFEEVIRSDFHKEVCTEQSPEKTFEENLRSTIESTFDFISSMHLNCTGRSKQAKSMIESIIQEQLAIIIVKHKSSLSNYRTDFQNDLEATALSWSIYGVCLNWVHNKMGKPKDEYVNELMVIIESINSCKEALRKRANTNILSVKKKEKMVSF